MLLRKYLLSCYKIIYFFHPLQYIEDLGDLSIFVILPGPTLDTDQSPHPDGQILNPLMSLTLVLNDKNLLESLQSSDLT